MTASKARLEMPHFWWLARATSVETVDSKVLDLARNDIIWHQVKASIEDVPGKTMLGLNVVEFNDEDQAEMHEKVSSLVSFGSRSRKWRKWHHRFSGD